MNCLAIFCHIFLNHIVLLFLLRNICHSFFIFKLHHDKIIAFKIRKIIKILYNLMFIFHNNMHMILLSANHFIFPHIHTVILTFDFVNFNSNKCRSTKKKKSKIWKHLNAQVYISALNPALTKWVAVKCFCHFIRFVCKNINQKKTKKNLEII